MLSTSCMGSCCVNIARQSASSQYTCCCNSSSRRLLPLSLPLSLSPPPLPPSGAPLAPPSDELTARNGKSQAGYSSVSSCPDLIAGQNFSRGICCFLLRMSMHDSEPCTPSCPGASLPGVENQVTGLSSYGGKKHGPPVPYKCPRRVCV